MPMMLNAKEVRTKADLWVIHVVDVENLICVKVPVSGLSYSISYRPSVIIELKEP